MAEIINKRGNAKLIASKRSDAKTQPAEAANSKSSVRWPAEGPHAHPHLINESATPGAGLFSRQPTDDIDVDPGAG